MIRLLCSTCENIFESLEAPDMRYACPKCGSEQTYDPAHPPTFLPPAAPVPTDLEHAVTQPQRHVSPRMTLPLDVTAVGAERAAVALFVGAFVEAVMDGSDGAEVRVRRRGKSLQLVANRFIPGGRRVEDSLHVMEDALGRAVAPWELGRNHGEACARVLRAAAPEDEGPLV